MRAGASIAEKPGLRLVGRVLVLGLVASSAVAARGDAPAWRELAPGLEMTEFVPGKKSEVGDSRIVVVRADPARWEVDVVGRIRGGGSAGKTAREWATEAGLVVATNAGMFATDYFSHLGYVEVRGEILALRQREFVHAARGLGCSPKRIIIRHMMPNLLPPLVIQATFGLAAAVVAEGSLSFLGLGVAPPTPSWGSMLNEGRQFLLVAPHLTTYPGLALMSTVLTLNRLGDALQDRLRPEGRELTI